MGRGGRGRSALPKTSSTCVATPGHNWRCHACCRHTWPFLVLPHSASPGAVMHDRTWRCHTLRRHTSAAAALAVATATAHPP
eukprot:355521-Chlamydomonas_euryale.AAC.5